MFLGLGPAETLWLALVVFGAAWVRGYSGFGFSALVVAGAGLVTDPRMLVPVVMICEISMTVGQARGIAGQIDWRRAALLIGGAAVAMPFGVHLIAQVGGDLARVAISLFVLGMCAALLTGWRPSRPVGRLGHLGVGAVSGIANGAAIGGLPVAVFMAGQPVAAAIFRATMIVHLTAIDLLALPLLWHAGLASADSLHAALGIGPICALGLWLGGRRFAGASPQDFRKFALIVLVGLALLGLARGLIMPTGG